MANMTFKASLLPNSDLGYSLGSSTQRWNIYGNLTGNASTADKWKTAITLTIGNTGKSVDGSADITWSKAEILGSSSSAYFYRGDQTWSDTISGNTLKITNNSNTLTIGSQNSSYCHIENSANIPFYFNRNIYVNGHLYPYGDTNTKNLGYSTSRWAKLYIGTADSYGGTAKPIYWNAGVPTAITETIGNTTTPAYVNAGTLTAGYPYLRYINTNDTTTWTADSLSQTDSIAFTRANITGAYTTGHIVWLNARTIGTPFQLVVHDSSDLYLYKRWYSSDAWSAWTKMNAGYADTAGTATSATTSTKTGDGTIYLYANNANEINFGGTSTVTDIYIGYRATDSRGIPGNFIFGGRGNATITAANFTGNAASASTLKPQYVTGVNPNTMYTTGFYTIGSLASGATLPVSCWAEMAVFNYHTNGGSGRVLQIVWHDNEADGNRVHFMRSCYDGTWKAWKQIWIQGNAVTGAVWNDYAEYRETKDCDDFGYVVFENGDDTLSKTTERLQHFAGITSDTWGFAQGQTDNAKTPIAVAGRVLAYPYQDRNNYKPGDCLCAAPGGTVDIMIREEVRDWPDRIVGTVSCVPDYEEWGGGELADRPSVKVNGRIWVKVR